MLTRNAIRRDLDGDSKQELKLTYSSLCGSVPWAVAERVEWASEAKNNEIVYLRNNAD